MLHWLHDHAVLAGLAVAVPALLLAARQFLPPLLGRAAGAGVGYLLDHGDEADDELVHALVVWAEKKLGGRGQGKEKFALVANRLIAIFPALDGKKERLVEIIERAVDRMEDEAEKRFAPKAGELPPVAPPTA